MATTQAETKAEAKAESKPEMKAEAKPETKPETIPETTTETKAEAKAETQAGTTEPAKDTIVPKNWGRIIGYNRCTRCVRIVEVHRHEHQMNDNLSSCGVVVRKIASPVPKAAWPEDAHEAYDEVKRLTALPDNRNLMKFRALFKGDFEMDLSKRKPFIEMEFMRKGSLNSKIQHNFNFREAFKERQILSYTKQLLSAVTFLHSNKIFHRDIRPKNIFILDDDLLKLADVACPKIYQNRTHCSRFAGGFWIGAKSRTKSKITQSRVSSSCCMSSPASWPYMPPEIMCSYGKTARQDIHVNSSADEHIYSAASDAWSIGVTLYEMLALKVPFAGRTPKQIQKSIADAAPLSQLHVPAVRNYSHQVVCMVNQLLHIEPKYRITVNKLHSDVTEIIQQAKLLNASTEGDLTTVMKIVKERVNIDGQDRNGYTALIKAAESGHVDIVDFLLKNKAHPDLATKSGGTASDWATSEEIKKKVKSASDSFRTTKLSS